MKHFGNIRAVVGVIVLAILLVPDMGTADDAELFTTRVLPNVLLVIDKSGSMDFPSGSTGIGNLDGNSSNPYGPDGNTRMDVLYKVVYTLLNADGSIPPGGGTGGSTTKYTCSLQGDGRKTGTHHDGDAQNPIFEGSTYSQMSISNCDPNHPHWYDTLVSGDTVSVGTSGESVIITGEGDCTGSNHVGRCVFFTSQSFGATYYPGAPVVMTHTVVGTGGFKYVYPYPGPASRVPATSPTNERTQATGDYAALTQLSGEDEKKLKARIGLMTFSGTSVSNSDIKVWAKYSASANTLPFSATSGYRYYDVWNSLKSTVAGGGTPTAKALSVAKNWFTDSTNGAYNATDNCRANYVVLITDGEDTYGYHTGCDLCGPGSAGSYISGGVFNADGSTTGTGQVSRNNDLITWAKNLYDNTTKITLFTIGVGMPQVAPSPLPSGVPTGGITTPSLRLLRDVLRRAAEQTGDTYSSVSAANNIGNASTDCTARGAGRAFFANDATEVSAALGAVFEQILAGEYSFTAPTVASVRTTDRNYLFLGSFQPNSPPQTQWRGHLDAYTINAIDNTTWRWDAETPLITISDSNRRMCTSSASGNRTVFTTSIDNSLLGVDTTRRTTVVNYVRGLASGGRTYKPTEPTGWKLGDIFHSKPALVGPPSLFYQDAGYSNTSQGGSTSFLEAKQHRTRVVYAGSNDGALHAFWAGDWSGSSYGYGDGREMFAYIPGSLLAKLSWMVPSPGTKHRYYVDSSPRIADVWLDTNNNNQKESTEWRTVLVSGLRGGGSGYFALDITNPPSGTSTDAIDTGGYAAATYPIALWEYDNTAILGESWSEPYIAKVRIRNQATGTADQTAVRDRWVAVFGGGKSSEGQGRTLIVLDIKDGTPLKVFDNVAGISGDIIASPTAVLDGSGYVRYIYVPDISGNLYKFDLRQTGTVSTGLGEWTAVQRFSPSTTLAQPVYHRAEVAVVTDSERWIFFGTGNQEYPITDSGTGKFFGIHDLDGSTPTLITDGMLTPVHANMNLAAGTTTVGASGWKIDLSLVPANSFDAGSHSGEKVLSDPVVFNNNVFFTTYTGTSTSPCLGGGIARIYGVNQLTAGAAMSADSRFDESGTGVVSRHATSSLGVASSPTLSVNPSGDSSIFIGFSGLPGGTGTSREILVPSPLKMKNLKDWKEIL